MKRKFTKLTAAFALLAALCVPLGMWGQTRESYSVTYDVEALGDMFVDGSSYASANGYWKVPASAGNLAIISVPITQQPESNITVTFNIATFGNGDTPSSSNTTISALGTETDSNWSGSGVNSYPSSSTYVDGVMTITKPANPTTLGGLNITMGVNSGVKIFRLQSITVAYTYGGGTQPETYTVTFDAGDGTFVGNNDFPNASNTKEAGTYTLPSATPADGYTFDGWLLSGSTTPLTGDYTVSSSVAFTAAYTENTTPGGEEHWVLTSLADLTANDVFVIVGNNGSNYAMKNSDASNTGPVVVAVTVDGNELTGTIGNNIKWNISGNASDGYIFYPNGSSTTWLYCTNNNNGLRIGNGNTDYNTFEIKDSYIYNKGRGRYVGIYNSTDWRSYTSIGTNIANQTFAFYKKVTGDVIPPSITANNVNIAYDATNGSIVYTINNGVEGGTLTAATESEWLTLPNTFASPIEFTCTANEATTARTATVTLTYTYSRETVTKDVTVTQAAAPVIYTTIPALFAAATGTETSVLVTFNNWVVSGVSTNGKSVFVTDNQGNGFVIFNNNGGLNQVYAAGNILAGTAVSCTLKKYSGYAQLNVDANDLTITTGGTVTVANIAMANLAGVNTGALLHYDNLTCSIDNNKYYLSDGTTTLQVYNALFAFEALVADKHYNITGVYQQFNSTKEILPRSAEDIVESTVPSITVTPATVNLTSEETGAFLTVAYENLADEPDFDVLFVDANGDEAEYDWLGYTYEDIESIELQAQVNDGEARTAYVMVTGYDAAFNLVQSNIVTVNQAAYVPPFEPATYIPATDINPEKRYIIVGFNGDDAYAMGYQKTNNRHAVGISFDGTTATVETSEVYELVIANQGDYYTIYDERTPGYLYAASNEKNYLKTEEELDANGNGLWNITFGEQGLVDLVAVNTNVRNVMQFNAGSSTTDPLFACYASANQEPVYLYEKVESAEYTLEITGYTDDSEKTGYHLIASPVFVDPYLVGMADGDFDLYSFDQSEEEEWRNYEAGSFTMLEPGKGYLYAKKATDNVQTYYFNLSGTPYVGDGIIDLTYDASEGVDFPGLNLIGNPFGEEATLNLPFYRMNLAGSGFEAVEETGSTVNAKEGVFVYAEYEDGYVTNYAQFTPNGNTSGGGGMKINLTRNRGTVIDNAIVRFDNGRQLPKFQLFENSTKLYIPQGNKDYAIVRSANEGEMSVSFKAEKNGTYTLNIEAENVNMNYLHLIDNLTGMDVDLLQTPSYTFEAKTSDYASRFRLVFKASSTSSEADETFAYFNGSSWTISNLGEATLQVVDVTGRTVANQMINGNAELNLNQPAGVYVIRLVNGDNVKTQKVVVR